MTRPHAFYGFGSDSKRSVASVRRKSVRRRPTVLLNYEPLEVRITPATYVWSGADVAVSPDFSDGNNWVGNVAPPPNSDLDFPATSANFNPVDDTGDTYNSIAIDAAGYNITPATTQQLPLLSGVTTTYTSGTSTVGNSIVIGGGVGSTTFQIAGGGSLLLTAPIETSLSTAALTETGAGTLDIDAPASYTGPTIIDGGTLYLQSSIASSNAVTVNAGGTLAGDGTAPGVTSIGGTVGANYNGSTNLLTVSSLSLDSNSTFSAFISGNTAGSGPNQYDQVDVSGALSLGNATLNATIRGSYVPALGDTLDLIEGASSTTGQFAGLPQGSDITLINAVTQDAYTFQISYTGGASGNDVVLTYVQQSTTAAVTTNTPNPSVYGQPVTLSATVSPQFAGTPSGQVDFYDNGTTLLGQGTLNASGVASISTTSALPTGSNSITAVYLGNANYLASPSSADVTQTVNQASTSSSVTSSLNPSVYGQSVTFTATVSPTAPGVGTPTGTVTFEDGTTPLATLPLNGSDQATYTTSSLSTATHSITVIYNGDTNFLTSTSSPALSQVVNQDATTTTLVSSTPNPTVFGQSVVYTIQVVSNAPGAGVPTGQVIIRDFGNQIGLATLDGSGQATFSTPALIVGGHMITVSYLGDTNNLPSTSSPFVQAVSKANATDLLGTSGTPSVVGQPVTFTATIAALAPGAGTPTGTVTFEDGSTPIGTETLSGGVATLTTTALSLGSNSITAVYSGDNGFNGVTSLATTQVVNQASTSTTLQSSSNPSVYGQSVTFTATVTPTSPATGVPTGTVTFEDGSTPIGTGTLNIGGVATFTTSALSTSTHSITAIYGGDPNYISSTSSAVSQVVNQDNATVGVTSSVNPSASGQVVTFTVNVGAAAPGSGTPTGDVTILDGTTILANDLPLTDGSATFNDGSLTVGSHPISVVYSGDTNFITATSGTLPQQVNLASSSVGIVSSIPSTVFGQSTLLTANVSEILPGQGIPTGTVTFYDGTTSLGTGTLSNGIATLSVGSLSVGTHSLTASYGGDADFSGSTSAAITQTVGLASSLATVTSPGSTEYGQPVTLTATLTGVSPGAGTPSGVVVFEDGSTPIATETLSGGVATYTTSSFSVGTHQITVIYGGDNNFLGTTSAAYSQVVGQGSTSTILQSSSNPSVQGQPVTFTAVVTATSPAAGTPTGTVTFEDGTTVLGTGTLSTSGLATFTTSSLSTSTHSITAIYGGDTNFITSTSPVVSQVVNQASTSTTLQSSSNPSVYGQSVTFTATVAATTPGAGTPTGTVTFEDGSTPIGTGTLNVGGVATFTTSALSTSTHSITAIYGGDPNYVTSTSSAVSQVVNQDNATVGVTSSVNPSASGQVVTFTVNVGAAAPGSGTPTGDVTILDGTTILANDLPLTDGSATFNDGSLTVGSHPISVVYSGDTNFITATSGTLPQQVNLASSSVGIVSSIPSTVFGQSTLLTANVSEILPGQGIPTGTVTFYDGTTSLGTGTLSNGIATLSVGSLSVGTHSLTASYGGDADFSGSTSAAITQTVGLASSLATVTSPGSTEYGQPVTLTATLTGVSPGAGTPSGVVVFEDGSTPIATETLSGGVATYTTSSFSVGTHQITVIYGGDNNFLGTTSAVYDQVVVSASQSSTSVALTSDTNPTVFGQTTNLTATVTATSPGVGTPTGTVTFYDGTNLLGTETLNDSGVATDPVSSLSVGTHQITAVYSGDPYFTTSTSNTVSQVVNAANSSLNLTSSVNPSVYGQPITYTVTASAVPPGSGTPSESVSLTIDSVVVGTITLSNGTGTFTTTTPLTAGSHDVVATLAGDDDFNGSSDSLTQVVNQASTSTTVSSNNGTYYGQLVEITADINPVVPGVGSPTGAVEFFDGSTLLGTENANPAVNANAPYSTAIFATSTLSVGAHNISVVYIGDSNFSGSNGGLTQDVNKAPTIIPVVTNVRVSPSTYGQTTAFSFSVQPNIGIATPGISIKHADTVEPGGVASPTGTVTITDNTTVLATLPYAPVNGVMTYQTPTLPAGTNVITVTYSGDSNYLGTSASTTQVVVPASTYTLLRSSAPTAVYGQHVTYTATVYPYAPGVGTPSGTITFYSGNTVIGASTLVGGQATLTVSAGPVGSQNYIQAVFSPTNGNFGQNSSADILQTVIKASTSVVLYAQIFSGGTGYPSTVVVTSPAGGAATGTVTYYVNGKVYGTQKLVNGMAPGYYFPARYDHGKTFTVVYSGDQNFSGSSTSSPVVVPGVVPSVSKPLQVFRAKAARAVKRG